jgi:glyoxylase-like metal-dependent hydrolase (beta-lactamase superfamily II)
MFDRRDYGHGIYAFDAGYVRPILAAIHLVTHSGRVALIDTGSNDSLPNTLAMLQSLGLGVDAVDYVILTHIHLDHAGGAGAYMSAFPNAKLVVHTRGARHMVEPSKLVAGVSAVYGADYVSQVYGEILPIKAERIVEASDGLEVSLAGRVLRMLDTPGHARHHICIADTLSNGIFTGDMFGISYRELDVDGISFVFPTTSPSQFDPVEMFASIDRLLEAEPEAVYLTHYGRLQDVMQSGLQLKSHLAALIQIADEENVSLENRHQRIKTRMTHYLFECASKHGCRLPEETLLEIWATDLELNAQGLAVWLDSKA